MNNIDNYNNWGFCPLDSEGNVLDFDRDPDAGERYIGTGIGTDLHDGLERSRFITISTGISPQADAKLAREILDALHAKTSCEGLMQMVEGAIERHVDKQHYRYAGSHADRLRGVLSRYEDIAVKNLSGVKTWRDDMIVWMRAFSMNVDMVGNASTHGEKNARLRGLSELIESALSKLRHEEFDFSRSHWRHEDVFRSDFPTRHYLSRIHELEAEVKRLEGRAKVRPMAGNSDDFDDSDPFANE